MSAESVDVLIVGAGFSGLCMAIQLRKAGMDSFLVIEKGEELGGTWWYNQYPGCACDIPSHLYSFSFARNPDWSRKYSGQREILEYLRATAKRFGVADRIRLRTSLHEATWDEQRGVWHAVTGNGTRIEARVLVSGVGALHVPKNPDLPGLDRFIGPAFHSAEWNSAVDLQNKDVAVIGTGASAAQIVPSIAGRARKLYVFQRTPAWVLPRPDGPISQSWRRLYRTIPGLTRVVRTLIFLRIEMFVFGFLGNRRMHALASKQARKHLEKQITDPQLRARLTPDYEFGCKRVLISSEFYPALTRPNVELVTSGILEVRERSIVTEDGAERPLNALIFATGFRVTEMLRGIRIVGRGGIEIHETWRDRISAYLGITVSGFPNFFMLLGPNTGLGHNSVLLMIEAQVRYVMSCLRLMRKRGEPVMDVRPEVQQRFVEELRSRLPQTVWESGCRSWYQDARTGESAATWPGSVVAYRRRTRAAHAEDYVFSGARSATPLSEPAQAPTA